MKKTVNDMYNYCKANNIKMLSNYNADFWTDYKNNHERYDFLFRRMFKSFYYFLQDKTANIDSVVTDFTDEVYTHLLVNHKKYDELYRINVLDDTTYSLLDNYNVTETMSKTGNNSTSSTYGQRTDTSNDTIGAHTDTTNTTTGNSTTETLNKVSPFDNEPIATGISDNMLPKDKSTTTTDPRVDSGSVAYGSQSNTTSVVKGTQTDSVTGSDSENYTLTRVGNIGVQTPTDILEKHKNFWSKWEFYTFVFNEISKELLSLEG